MRLRDDLMLRHLGKDHIIVDPGQDMVDMSRVYVLNDVAALVWEAIQGKEFTAETILELLLKNYEVGRNQAVKGAQYLLNEFKSQGLVAGNA